MSPTCYLKEGVGPKELHQKGKGVGGKSLTNTKHNETTRPSDMNSKLQLGKVCIRNNFKFIVSTIMYRKTIQKTK